MLSLPPEIRQKLRARLAGEEDIRRFPYVDSLGVLSIGCGRNLRDKGISVEEALYLLDNDIMDAEKQLWHYCADWYTGLDDIRKSVVIDMALNEGIGHLLEFKNMINYIKIKNYVGAAHEMISSEWAKQVKGRASKLALIMETGSL